MKLAAWIDANDKTRKEVADFLKVSPPYVTNLCSETPNWPSRDVMARLVELTRGEVTATDFLPVQEDAA